MGQAWGVGRRVGPGRCAGLGHRPGLTGLAEMAQGATQGLVLQGQDAHATRKRLLAHALRIRIGDPGGFFVAWGGESRYSVVECCEMEIQLILGAIR